MTGLLFACGGGQGGLGEESTACAYTGGKMGPGSCLVGRGREWGGESGGRTTGAAEARLFLRLLGHRKR